MSDEVKGDIFWDLAPYITYIAGYDVGCTIYVANPTNTEKEYSLMAQLSQSGKVISEEALPVFGYAWFKVDPGDIINLRGSFHFDQSNCVLTVFLVERESQTAVDSVLTCLVQPTTAALPPGWPSGVPAPTDWFSMLMPVVMFGAMGMVMVSAFKPAEEKKKVTPPVREEGKQLPPGRSE